MKRILLLTSILIAGCSTKAAVSLDAEFRPSLDFQSFEYKNHSDRLFPEGDITSERARLEVLEDRLAANQMCISGYEITNRQVVSLGSTIGNGAEIIYTGECL